MKLILIRHGKAEHKSPTGKDFDRNLSSEGTAQIKALAHHLSTQSINGQVFCSTANRTKQTFQTLKKVFSNEVLFLDDLYLASLQNLLTFIWKNTTKDSLTIIGHNNGLSDLASYFLGENIILGTGNYICLELNIERWNYATTNSAVLKDFFKSNPST